MRKEELRFVLDVLQERDVGGSEDLDWYAVVGYLELNKIGGYFYRRVKERGLRLPQSVERKLAGTLSVQTMRNRAMGEFLQSISDRLDAERLNCVFLKGSVMSHANFDLSEAGCACAGVSEEQKRKYEAQKKILFYREGERVSNDIDILIESKDVGRLEKMLADMGYRQGYYDFSENRIAEFDRREILQRRLNRGETAPFLLRVGNPVLPFVEIDINFSVDHLPNGSEDFVRRILENGIRYAGDLRGGIRSPQVSDFFLHLILHQYKECRLLSMVQRNKDAELYKLLDLYLFLKRGYIDLEALFRTVKAYGLEDAAYCVLQTVARVFDDLRLERVLEEIRPANAGYADVVDPPRRRRYVWTADPEQRMLCCNKASLLREVTRD